MQLHILWWAWSHGERKHRSLWPAFYVDTTTNQNIPPTNWSLDPKLRSVCAHLPNARLSLPTGVSVVVAVLCRPWRSACAAAVQSSRCWIWRRVGVSLLTGECRRLCWTRTFWRWCTCRWCGTRASRASSGYPWWQVCCGVSVLSYYLSSSFSRWTFNLKKLKTLTLNVQVVPVQTVRYQCSLGAPVRTVQWRRVTVEFVLLWWFLHQLMLRKNYRHTYGTLRTK